ncbi:hypothetical protein O1611_g3877 [Lasiodiplodia mahajangana]|uniref:Uncharacterized protein n=1 Tax=Lasiodiplodia mahajangana TaxID=1108764 RepID=A0ACC2JQQ6_9PEZI|nr:hypothetical protein O1611_g3877 [Lasiodiplodia mahajangana]
MWSLLDVALAIMWLAVAALAGQAAFGGPDKALASGIAVKDTHIMALFWVDLINMLLWLATLVEVALLCCTAHTVRRKLENLEMH